MMLGRSFTVGMVSSRKTALLVGQGKSGKERNNSNNTRITGNKNNDNSGVGFRGVHLGLKFRNGHNSKDMCAVYGAMRIFQASLRHPKILYPKSNSAVYGPWGGFYLTPLTHPTPQNLR